MLRGSGRFDADAHEFVAIFWGHGHWFGGQEGFSKGFRKGVAEKPAEAFAGSDLANGREHEGSRARRRLFGKVSPKAAKPEGRAFPMTPVEKSQGYGRSAPQENRISAPSRRLPTGITGLAAR